MKPFQIPSGPLEGPGGLFESHKNETYFEWLYDVVRNRRNAVLYGVRGVGKTSLLNSYFTPEKLRFLAQEKEEDGRGTIVCRHSFRQDEEPNGRTISIGLLDDLTTAVEDLLEQEGLGEETKSALEKAKEARRRAEKNAAENAYGVLTEEETVKAAWKRYVIALKKNGFSVVVVWDHFDEFTFSKNITLKDHDFMCARLKESSDGDKAGVSFLAVTDNDLHRGSLPYLEADTGSKFLTEIEGKGTSMTLGPISPKDVKTFLGPNARTDFSTFFNKDGFCFSKAVRKEIYLCSGGVPGLLYQAAEKAYSLVLGSEENGGEEYPALAEKEYKGLGLTDDEKTRLKMWEDMLKEELRKELATAYRPIMETSWFRSFTDMHKRVLDRMYIPQETATGKCKKGENDGLYDADIQALISRGILVQSKDAKTPDDYVAVSPLLPEIYRSWREKTKVESESAQRKPVTQNIQNIYYGTVNQIEKVETVHQGTVNQIEKVETVNQGTVNQIGKVEIAHIAVQNVLNVLQGDWTEENAPALTTSLLRELFPSALTEQGSLPEEQTTEELLESTAYVLPDTEELNALENDLDGLFHEAWNKIKPEQVFEETVELGRMSDACRCYVKLAVVTQDKLSYMETISGKYADFSAHLVFYGKALEQKLKDDFFKPFHETEEIRDFPTNRKKNGGGYCTFGELGDSSQTNIGSYSTLILKRIRELEEVSKLDRLWWKDLGKAIDNARNIRNRADHADDDETKIPKQSSVERMFDLLFGIDGSDEGIFRRIDRAAKALPNA